MLRQALLVAAWGKGRERQDYLHPPLGLYRLRNGLEEKGIGCEVFDPNISTDAYRDVLRAANYWEPDLIGFSSNHYSLPFDLSLAHHVQRNIARNTLLVGGGIAATEDHGSVLTHAPEGFIVVRGEGDATLPDLCMNPDRNRVLGLAWKEDANIILTPPRPPLDGRQFSQAINNIAWEDVPFEDYWQFLLRFHDPSVLIEQNLKTARIIVSSYCPRGCSFCSSTNFYKLAGCNGSSKVHRLSPEDTIGLLKRIVAAHDVKNFFFHDDDFLFSVPWVKRLCELIVQGKTEGSIPAETIFMAQGSVRNTTLVAKDLQRADFRLIGLGVESFSPRVLREFHKPQNPAHISRAIDSLLSADIIPYINLILSSPGSTLDDLIMTMVHGIRLLCRGASIAASLYTLAFPGAEITSSGDAEGLVTYCDHKIDGTDRVMRLTDKILPRDPLLRHILETSESRLAELDIEFFSGEGAFRSSFAPLMFLAIARSLEEKGIDLPSRLKEDLEANMDSRLENRISKSNGAADPDSEFRPFCIA